MNVTAPSMTTVPETDPLDDFLAWVLSGGATALGAIPLLEAVHDIEAVRSITWFRSPPFQVQMFIVPPNYVVPEHTHPNVDSYEIYLGGQIKFSHSGKWVISDYHFSEPSPNGTAFCRGFTIRVRPGDRHGGITGPAGGVFLSVQHWLNGVAPHCVAADYSGPVMGPDHLAKVVAGKPEPRQQEKLTENDALGEAKP
jgi:hypothetical protein